MGSWQQVPKSGERMIIKVKKKISGVRDGAEIRVQRQGGAEDKVPQLRRNKIRSREERC
jgi:hypothetical protein